MSVRVSPVFNTDVKRVPVTSVITSVTTVMYKRNSSTDRMQTPQQFDHQRQTGNSIEPVTSSLKLTRFYYNFYLYHQ